MSVSTARPGGPRRDKLSSRVNLTDYLVNKAALSEETKITFQDKRFKLAEKIKFKKAELAKTNNRVADLEATVDSLTTQQEMYKEIAQELESTKAKWETSQQDAKTCQSELENAEEFLLNEINELEQLLNDEASKDE